MTDIEDWTPPGAGVWWITTEHFPAGEPAVRGACSPVTAGWERASARYNLPLGRSSWAAVHSWYYFSPGSPDPSTYAPWRPPRWNVAQGGGARRSAGGSTRSDPR